MATEMTPYRDEEALAFHVDKLQRLNHALEQQVERFKSEERRSWAYQIAVQALGSMALYSVGAALSIGPFFVHPHLAAVIGTLNLFTIALGAAVRKFGI